MKLTVLVTHPIDREGLTELFEQCHVVYPQPGHSFGGAELIDRIGECDAVLACGAISAEAIAAAPKLKIISNYGAGYDRVDVEAARRAGVMVTNIPDSTCEATAELALALTLSLRRRVTELDRRIRAGEGEGLFGMGRNMGRSLAGATLGVVGMGRIGGRMAEMGQMMGMQVCYYNRRPVEGASARYLPLDELMKVSDVLSIHCPLTDQTRGLIGRQQIALMKKDAVLVNTARGAVVDEEALIEALESGRLGGAALDVYPREPKINQALLSMDQVVLTPHIGTNTVEARRGMARDAAHRILEVAAGRIPPNIVNGVSGLGG